MCPEVHAPAEPCLHSFSYTVTGDRRPAFVVAGSGEVPEGRGVYGDNIVARGDTSPTGLRKKVQAVLIEMERRLNLLGLVWAETTAVQAYCVHNIYPVFADEIVVRGAARNGLTWHYCRPPVLELEYEKDCRGLAIERVG